MEWKPFLSEQDKRGLLLKVGMKGSEYYLTVYEAANETKISLEVKIHPFINF